MFLFPDDKQATASSPEDQEEQADKIQDWPKFFSKGTVDPNVVRQLVLDLQAAKKHEDVIALIEQAIVQGQIQPWMYEVLALNMETVGRPRAQIERVLLSGPDLIADDSDSLLYLAAYLSKFERHEQALKLYRQVAVLEPLRVESYVMGLALAERLHDPTAAMWAVPGVLTRAWGKDRQELHDQAERVSKQICAELTENGRALEAASLEQLTNAAKQRDLTVLLEWNGAGDLDLEIVDPTGAVCNARQTTTPGGALHIRSGQGPRQQDCVEEAVVPFALPGEYRVLVKHVSGDIVGKRARLTITRAAGSSRETKQVQTVPLSAEGQTIRVSVKNGRLPAPLAIPEPPAPIKAAARRRPALGRVPEGNPRMPAENARNGVGTGVVGYQPVIEFVPSGVQLTALAVVSGDRRYVRISSSPLFTSLTDVFTFSFARGVTGP